MNPEDLAGIIYGHIVSFTTEDQILFISTIKVAEESKGRKLRVLDYIPGTTEFNVMEEIFADEYVGKTFEVVGPNPSHRGEAMLGLPVIGILGRNLSLLEWPEGNNLNTTKDLL